MKNIYFIVNLLFIGLNVQAQNVGIGTTTPTAKLEVNSSAFNEKVIYGTTTGQFGYGVYGAATNGGVGILGEAYSGNATAGYSVGGWLISDGVGNYALKAETLGNGTAAYFSSPTGNAVIVDQGNVGIAELAPTEKLHINNGNIKIGKALWASAADDKFLKIGDGPYVSIGEVGGDDLMEVRGKQITIRSNPASIGPFASAAGNVLIPNGNVGIGTINPTYKLTVNGNIRSKELVVETGWADFVFDKKYVLPSLSEVEKFIKANNHLPNIPSAEEIQTNGLKVGEVQTKMMQKIEELTLYIIELEKKVSTLQAKILSDK
jgi:hypothetical protein